MTSKISFSKITHQDMKRRIWVAAIVFLGFFMILPLSGLMTLESVMQQYSDGVIKYTTIIQRVTAWIGPANSVTSFWIVVSAIICGFTGFSYMHSRKKLDVYHSIPMKRERLFFSQYLSGLGIFFIPFLLCEVLSLLICLIRGVLSAEIAAAWGSGVLIYCLYFLVFYHVALLAIMLTGRMLVSVLGMLVFWCYTPLVMIVFQSYTASFFDTYYGMLSSTEGFMKILSYFSPLTLCFNGNFLAYSGVEAETTSSWWVSLVAAIVMAIVLFAVVIALYRKRPSEAAGHSMAFTKTESPIKVLLLIPISMAGGLILRMMSYNHSDLWLFFGVLFGLVIGHGVIEVIYHYDFRKIISRKVSLVTAGVAALLITVIYRADLFGYDTYLPSENQVVSAAVSIESMNTGIDYFEYSEEDGYYNYESPTTYRLNHMELNNTPEVLDIARAGINALKNRNSLEDVSLSNVTIKYTLNNGSDVYRQYSVNLEELEPQLEVLYSDMDYKKAVFPILGMDADRFGKIYAFDLMKEESMLSLSGADLVQIIETFKSELGQVTYSKMKEQPATGNLRFEITDGQMVYLDSLTYPVYPFFNKTLNLLEESGYQLATEIDSDKVIEVVTTKYQDIDYDSTGLITDMDSKTYTDKAEIEAILKSLVLGYDNNFDVDDSWEVSVTMFNQYDEETTQFFSFRKGAVPDFVAEQ